MSKTLDEIHRIRENIYEEEKNLNTQEILKKIRTESEEFMKKHNLKLRRRERELIKMH